MKNGFSAFILIIFCAFFICFEALAGLSAVKTSEGDWPWWRGPTRDGKAAMGQKPPVKWSETENIVWKAPVPGRGHGSPTIWGKKIFLATADDEAEEQYMLCYDLDTGKQLWKTLIHKGDFIISHRKNSYASGTPACDGERLFISFAVKEAAWITALDLDGKVIWQKEVVEFESKHGYVGTPAIYKSLVIVNADSEAKPEVVAYNRETGKEVWRTRRSVEHHSFSAPAIGRCCGKDQLVFVGPMKVESYDPNTGEQFWSCDGPSDVGANTATIGEKMVFASGGYPKRVLLGIKGDGKGDVTESHVAWKIAKNTAYATSILLHDGLLYMIFDNKGILRVIEEGSGKEVYQQQLSGECSASPILAGGNIYQTDEDGVVTVFKPGRKFEKIAENSLHDGGFASPTIVGGRIYLRTLHNLYCIGE